MLFCCSNATRSRLILLVAALIAAFACTGCHCLEPLSAHQQSLQQQQQGDAEHEHAVAAAAAAAGAPAADIMQPPIWPEQFKSVMFQNRTNKLALVTLYYDWRLGANLNIIGSQLGAAGTVWDLEWNNGTSFIFSRDQPVCKTLHFDVGILTPDWLKDSHYLGQTATDNFVTNVWTKAKFINYYADKETARPVRWTFLWSGAEFHTMAWDEGATLSSDLWQAPEYCFNQQPPSPDDPAAGGGGASILDNPIATGRIMRLEAAKEVVAQQQQHGLQQHLHSTQEAVENLLPTS